MKFKVVILISVALFGLLCGCSEVVRVRMYNNTQKDLWLLPEGIGSMDKRITISQGKSTIVEYHASDLYLMTQDEVFIYSNVPASMRLATRTRPRIVNVQVETNMHIYYSGQSATGVVSNVGVQPYGYPVPAKKVIKR